MQSGGSYAVNLSMINDRSMRILPDGVKPIPGFPGYFASKRGTIWSTKRGQPRKLKTHWHGGYRCLTDSCPGKYKNQKVHKLIALAFLPNPENLPYACHRDDNKSHNYLSNIYWGTPTTNRLDMLRNNKKAKEGYHGHLTVQ